MKIYNIYILNNEGFLGGIEIWPKKEVYFQGVIPVMVFIHFMII